MQTLFLNFVAICTKKVLFYLFKQHILFQNALFIMSSQPIEIEDPKGAKAKPAAELEDSSATEPDSGKQKQYSKKLCK